MTELDAILKIILDPAWEEILQGFIKEYAKQFDIRAKKH